MPNRVKEFHNIMPLTNITSVVTDGLLSHKRASSLPHADVSMEAIQEKRDKKTVPNGLTLHEYANVYFHARNPMMYKQRERIASLCVLRISIDILKLNGVVITDQNASSDYVKFLAPSQIRELSFDKIFAEDWRHPDQVTYWRNKSAKCAEVLVPNLIQPSYILGAYVVNNQVEQELKRSGFPGNIEINPNMFFR
jgi:hypothetical protein